MSDYSDGVASLVHVVFSRLVVEHGDSRGADIHLLQRALRYYEASPDEPSATTLTTGSNAFEAVEATRAELREQWEGVRHRFRVRAALELTVVKGVFSEADWSTMACLIMDGPGEFAARAEAALYAYSRRRVPPSRARPNGGSLTPATVSNVIWAFRRVAAMLVGLRGLQYPCPALEPWTAVPPIQMPPVTPAVTDRSAPPLRLVRRVLRDLDRDVHARLRCHAGGELAAITAMSDSSLRAAGVWMPVKRRAILALLSVVGMRVGALCRLRTSDYRVDYQFADGNGTVGPAIRLLPGKNLPATLERWKGIGPKEVEIIEVLLALAVRLAPIEARAKQRPIELLPSDPMMFPSSLRTLESPMTPGGISDMLGGGGPRSVALLPKASPAEIAADPSLRSVGFSAHTLRHLSHQVLKHAADVALERDGLRHVSREAVAAAVQDHSVTEDVNGYNDVSSESGRERWARYGILAASERIWTDAGAVVVPDVESIRRNLRTQKTVRRAAEIAEHRCHEIERRARGANQPPSAQDVLDLVAATNDERRARQELHSLQADYERLANDRATWLALPDDAPAEAATVDLDAIRDAFSVGESLSQTMSPVREFLTVTELAYVFGVSTATARRWTTGAGMPHRVGHPANPWESGGAPVDFSRGARRRRVWIGGIKPSALSTEQQQLVHELSCRWPEGWSREDARAPLVLDDWIDARRAA